MTSAQHGAASSKGVPASAGGPPAVRSIIDTDLYKLTMQQAVLEHYPDADVSYRFTNRSMNMKFTPAAVNAIRSSIFSLSSLQLTAVERAWLSERCPYLQPRYLDYLQAFRFKPEEEVIVSEVNVSDDLVDLQIKVEGKWKDVILYEVPLMSIVSQAYFELVDTDWTMDGQEELAASKANRLIAAGIKFSEFGSRRRRSYETHRSVMQGLLRGEREALSQSIGTGKMLGTSNVHFARLFDIIPVGTVAHEWTMALAALEGYDRINLTSLRKWDEVYAPPAFTPTNPSEDLTIALTDTFSTEVFWKDLLRDDEDGNSGKAESSDAQNGKEIMRRWRGVRQDSGDSKAFARRAKQEYQRLGVDPKSKVIIFSDGLDVERCIELASYANEIGIGAGFGVGTNLTNDFRKLSTVSPVAAAPNKIAASAIRDSSSNKASSSIATTQDILDAHSRGKGEKSKALNIVIKMYSLNGKPTVKISDELTKNTGDPEEVKLVKRRFGLDAHEAAQQVEDA